MAVRAEKAYQPQTPPTVPSLAAGPKTVQGTCLAPRSPRHHSSRGDIRVQSTLE